jgi:hypothetical protein
MGRWPNRDPIGEDGGTALYCYILNVPITDTDPLGKAPKQGKQDEPCCNASWRDLKVKLMKGDRNGWGRPIGSAQQMGYHCGLNLLATIEEDTERPGGDIEHCAVAAWFGNVLSRGNEDFPAVNAAGDSILVKAGDDGGGDLLNAKNEFNTWLGIQSLTEAGFSGGWSSGETRLPMKRRLKDSDVGSNKPLLGWWAHARQIGGDENTGWINAKLRGRTLETGARYKWTIPFAAIMIDTASPGRPKVVGNPITGNMVVEFTYGTRRGERNYRHLATWFPLNVTQLPLPIAEAGQ